jgi:plastocyanin
MLARLRMRAGCAASCSQPEELMNRITLAAGAILAIAATTAQATDHIVVARGGPNRFDPATLEIAVGDTVTFINNPDGPGFHNVVSDTDSVTPFRCANGCDGDGGNGDASNSLWTATVTFPDAGTAPYHCEIHGLDGGGGMSGTITIIGDVGVPVIGVDATAIDGSAEEGASTSVPFTISNTGNADLIWTADTASQDCATPDTVPWLSLAPTGGTVLVGDPGTVVDVTLDAATLTAGVYNANVCVHSNDATNALIGLPVTFTVDIPDAIFGNGFDP